MNLAHLAGTLSSTETSATHLLPALYQSFRQRPLIWMQSSMMLSVLLKYMPTFQSAVASRFQCRFFGGTESAGLRPQFREFAELVNDCACFLSVLCMFTASSGEEFQKCSAALPLSLLLLWLCKA